MTLNENPENYFAQIEQAAFSPAHMPPGIEASPDKMLQVCRNKIMSKVDHFVNIKHFRVVFFHMLIHIFIVLERTIILFQLTILKQIKMLKFALINVMVLCKQVITKVSLVNLFEIKKKIMISFRFFSQTLGAAPNYFRNSYNGPDITSREKHIEHATFESGMAARHEASEDDNFSQPRVFYHVRESNLTN